MTYSEIKSLKQGGRLEEALQLAEQAYHALPNGTWQRNCLAWIYDALCKRASAEGNLDSFRAALLPLSQLGVITSDPILYDSLCWRFRALISQCSLTLKTDQAIAFADSVFELVLLLGKPHPSLASSVLCKAFLHLNAGWRGFRMFMDWWGWETFRPEDYLPETLPNGSRLPLSLVESCYIRCAKLLLETGDKEAIQSFLMRLTQLSDAHPEMLYPGYFAGKLMMRIGTDRSSILHNVLPFVRKKKSEFWAWQLLAEAERSNPEIYLACLLRAVNCKTKDTFLLKVLYQLSAQYVMTADYGAASYYLTRYVNSKNTFGSNLPDDVWHWIHEPWYKATNKKPIPTIDYQQITDSLLYLDIPEVPMVITHVNTAKSIVSVVYGERKHGFFCYRNILTTPAVGECLLARAEIGDNDSHLHVHTARITEKEELRGSSFLKVVTGEVTANKAGTAHFLKFGKEYAFLSTQLLTRNNLGKGSCCTCWVVLNYEKTKDRWSWACVDLAA